MFNLKYMYVCMLGEMTGTYM